MEIFTEGAGSHFFLSDKIKIYLADFKKRLRRHDMKNQTGESVDEVGSNHNHLSNVLFPLQLQIFLPAG